MKKSPWQIYKEKRDSGEVTPFSLMNPSNYTDEETSSKRLEICKQCDRFKKNTTQCMECGCFMIAKTRLSQATCPLGKW